MVKKNKTLIEKLKNHFMSHGKKRISEKNFLKSIKFLQKATSKKTSDILKLSIVFSTAVFVANKTTKRNVITVTPKYLLNDFSRISLAIKFIVQTCRQKKGEGFSASFCEEILLNSQKKGLAVQKKIDLHSQTGGKSIYNVFYRW